MSRVSLESHHTTIHSCISTHCVVGGLETLILCTLCGETCFVLLNFVFFLIKIILTDVNIASHKMKMNKYEDKSHSQIVSFLPCLDGVQGHPATTTHNHDNV